MVFRPRHGKRGYSTVAFGFTSSESAKKDASKMDDAYVYKKGKLYGIRSR
jgi:hypothetical protein